jgi:hypothetical protein
MTSFRWIPQEGLRASLDQDEATLLRHLIDEMKTLLEADLPRVDPVTARLFPDAHEDTEEAESYRSLIGHELRTAKLEALEAVSSRLGKSGALETSIPEDEVTPWLTLVNDLRLAIGTRLEVDETKMGSELDPEHPDTPAMSVLHWLGWVQESILTAMTGRETDDA